MPTTLTNLNAVPVFTGAAIIISTKGPIGPFPDRATAIAYLTNPPATTLVAAQYWIIPFATGQSDQNLSDNLVGVAPHYSAA
jgi:hypothetical protein